MKRMASAVLGGTATALYWLGFAALFATHVYATVLAYNYVYAWKMSRALLWVFITFLIPVLSTIYWLVVHWLQTDVFWNSFTLTCAAGVGLILCGMLLETLKQLMPG
jgi:hypothetical protein